jgi:hypothetical protein
LHLVAEEVERVLNLLRPDVVFLQLAAFDGQFTPGALQLLALLRNLSLVFGLVRFQEGNLISAVLQALVEHLDVFLGVIQVLEHALVAGLEVAVRRVHVVQLAFELKTQLHLFLVVLRA